MDPDNQNLQNSPIYKKLLHEKTHLDQEVQKIKEDKQELQITNLKLINETKSKETKILKLNKKLNFLQNKNSELLDFKIKSQERIDLLNKDFKTMEKDMMQLVDRIDQMNNQKKIEEENSIKKLQDRIKEIEDKLVKTKFQNLQLIRVSYIFFLFI